MEILVLGDKRRIEELLPKIPPENNVHQASELYDTSLSSIDVVFDLNFDDNPINLENYALRNDLTVFCGTVKSQLAATVHHFQREVRCALFGMNSLPTFINREMMEFSLLRKADLSKLEEITARLSWKYKLVEDRVGMVTPRIIFMIINEACYTVQEGTASMVDIDLAMKLGTNYPKGPFEWADQIGIKEIYETLSAIYQDTHDERYKICPMLKSNYLKGESFYKF